MDYYGLEYDDFHEHSDIPFDLVEDYEALNQKIARDIAERLKANNEVGQDTTAILPVGPLDYTFLADICNEERIDLRRLRVYMMDEYMNEEGEAISENHPLSFRRFMKETLVDNLDDELGLDMDQIIFPDPANTDEISQEILEMDGVEVCYGGFGITGHFAFNDPPEPDDTTTDLNDLRESRTRVLEITRESVTQMVMGGSHGNWDIVPRQAVTLGMKELLASDEIHLTFMRSWHAGVLRRTLFGPVSVDCPGSLLQEHDQVEVTLTEIAAEPPVLNVDQDIGE
jgi:glucosamine-6-phosphate deaminase